MTWVNTTKNYNLLRFPIINYNNVLKKTVVYYCDFQAMIQKARITLNYIIMCTHDAVYCQYI